MPLPVKTTMESARIASSVLEAAFLRHVWALVLPMDLRTSEQAEGGQPRGMQCRMELFLVGYALDGLVFHLGSSLRGHPDRFAVAVALSG